jgi:hypothetical protein
MTATREDLRETVTIALTAAEAEVIARANAALSWIGSDDFPWPADSGLIKMYAGCLRDSLADYAGLTAGNCHPASLFPDLGHGQDNAMEQALDRVTQDITDWTRELVVLGNRAEEARARQERRAS